MAISVIVLAAGQGTRMKSALPKVLHELGGKPMLGHVLDTAASLKAEQVNVVIGHGGELLRGALSGRDCTWVEQAQRLGTGHAVSQALPTIPDDHQVLVLYGDVPLIRVETLWGLLRILSPKHLALLTTNLDDPAGYGRIVRDSNEQVSAIVEQKDASPQQRMIREINTGFLAANAADLKRWLSRVTNENAQGEYYLTDIVRLAVADGCTVLTSAPTSVDEIMGVNDRAQLAELERLYQRRIASNLMTKGVTLRDPARIDVRGQLQTGTDCIIDVNAVFEGNVELGDNVQIGPNVYIKDSKISDNVVIMANSVLDGATIGSGCKVGPFARVRPGTQLESNVHIGNFVEVKQSIIRSGSKINHLSYVGDARIGRDVNIGAGTITCNYDGVNKHETVIGDRVFIGSDTQLVAPITVGNDCTIGAGTTVTKSVPDGVLVISRVPQQVKSGWRRPKQKG